MFLLWLLLMTAFLVASLLNSIYNSLSMLVTTLLLLLTFLATIEYFLELFIISIVFAFFDLFLKLIDLFDVLPLFLVSFSLFVCLNRLLKFLVFHFLLPLFERLNLMLLLEKTRLHLSHVSISLQHLCKEIIWSANGHFCLN
jgi:hypothetical protein